MGFYFEFFSIAFLYVSIAFGVALCILKKKSIFNPLSAFSVLALISFYPVIRFFGESYNLIIVFIYLLLFYSFVLGYILGSSSGSFSLPSAYNSNVLFYFGVGFFLISFLIWVAALFETGGIDFLLSSTRQQKMLVGRGIRFYGIYNHLLVVSIVLIASSYAVSKKNGTLVFLGVVVSFKIALAVLYVSRNFIVETLVVVFIFWELLSDKKIKLSFVIVLLIPLLFFSNNFKTLISNPAGVLSGSQLNFSLEPGLLQSQYIIVKDIVENYDDIEWEKKYGISYLEAFFVRSNPFLDGESLSQWYSKLFYFDKFEKGGGQGFSQVAEGYLAFGFFGVVLVGCVYGFFLSFVYSNLNKNLFYVILYVIFFMALVRLLRSEFTSVFNGYFMYRFLPAFFVLILAKKKYFLQVAKR